MNYIFCDIRPCCTLLCVHLKEGLSLCGLRCSKSCALEQVDCPEDVATYIHRVGRTARYTASGRSLLFLTPSEEKMLAGLTDAKIPIKVIKVGLSFP